MSVKSFYPTLYFNANGLFSDKECEHNYGSENNDPVTIAERFEEAGADGIIFYDISKDDISHERFINDLRKITKQTDIDILAGGHINRLEDVKKYLYAGVFICVIDKGSKDSLTGEDIFESACERFGVEKIALKEENGSIVLQDGIIKNTESEDVIIETLNEPLTVGITGTDISDTSFDFYKWKSECLKKNIDVNMFVPSVDFSEFICNDQGLIPVIVQDHKTDEVLMLAWMNEDSFKKTIETGMMTYFSRSRNELWVKGETSGHFQYVRSMSLDCDNDTLLAKVKQVGAACHTGNRSCFYRELFSKKGSAKNPFKVFSELMDVINDRKDNPKEGSYTTYLFEQGIDKILKKCGEEAAEVIIAAKNPDPEEIKYELADFIYHAMVLMSLKGVTWEDVVRELANR